MWIKGQADKEAKSDVLRSTERWAQLAAIVCSALAIAFFAIHQTRPTGFFTEDFGTGGEILLYAMLLVSAVSPLVKLLVGRKNPARPYEVVGMMIAFVGQLYFLIVFPFDFEHFADPLPHSLEFLLDWIPEWLAKLALVLGVIGTAVFSVYNSVLYLAVKQRLSTAGVCLGQAGQQ